MSVLEKSRLQEPPVEDLFSDKKDCIIPIVKSPEDCPVYRINKDDTNRLAIVFDSSIADNSLTVCIEIFDVGGQTPYHSHHSAAEMFFILKGEGLAICDGKNIPLKSGDSLLVRATGVHKIVNTGFNRLYTLCFMVPNEDFSELIRRGIPEELDQEDKDVLQRIYH